MKKPWLFSRVYRGWKTTQSCGDYFINHSFRILSLNNHDSLKVLGTRVCLTGSNIWHLRKHPRNSTNWVPKQKAIIFKKGPPVPNHPFIILGSPCVSFPVGGYTLDLPPPHPVTVTTSKPSALWLLSWVGGGRPKLYRILGLFLGQDSQVSAGKRWNIFQGEVQGSSYFTVAS